MPEQREPDSEATPGADGDVPADSPPVGEAPGTAWVVGLLDRLAATSTVSERPGDVTFAELRRLREHLASTILHIPRLTRADESVVGHRVSQEAQPIRPGGLVTVQVAKFVKHVLNDAEWDPDTTSLADYLAELEEIVLDERSDLFLEDDAGNWKLTFGRRGTREQEQAYTVVSFIPVKGLWLTGFRPERGRSYVSERGSTRRGRWINIIR